MYNSGQGVEQDYKQAFAWFKKAAEQGRDAAQYNLGSMYLKGEGVQKNYQEALTWSLKAKDQGDVNAIIRSNILERFFNTLRSADLMMSACQDFGIDTNEVRTFQEPLELNNARYSAIGKYIQTVTSRLEGMDLPPLDPNDRSQIKALFDFCVESKLIDESERALYQEELFPSE